MEYHTVLTQKQVWPYDLQGNKNEYIGNACICLNSPMRPHIHIIDYANIHRSSLELYMHSCMHTQKTKSSSINH